MLEIISNWIDKALSPGRHITGKLVDADNFWVEVERAYFLINNLQDPDLNWGLPHSYLNQISKYLSNNFYRTIKSELLVVTTLYTAWNSISSQIVELNDYELDPWWNYKFETSLRHIDERVMPYLSMNDQIRFQEFLPLIHRSNNNKIFIDVSDLCQR